MEKDSKYYVNIKKHLAAYLGVVAVFAIFKYIEDYS
jgi:hypothetical protein